LLFVKVAGSSKKDRKEGGGEGEENREKRQSSPLLVDLCCGAGGAALGYGRAGFDVVGVDIEPQPRYPFRFIQADVMSLDLEKEFPDAACFHASPPCQPFSVSTKRYRNAGKAYPDILAALREKLRRTGKPFVLENVPGAPMPNRFVLCGEMFGLRVIRHRWFEVENAVVFAPPHVEHRGYATGVRDDKEWIKAGSFYYYTVCGNGRRSYDTHDAWARAMGGLEHMTKYEMAQAIPPAYTEYIGRQLIGQLRW
jgi:DNA (cytosine-5)-methyltransferase 1